MPGEFGNNTLFVWEFQHDIVNKKILQIKYFALDEIFGFVGGNLSLALSIAGFVINPFAIIKFVINNSSKKEEIEMQICQAQNYDEDSKIFNELKHVKNFDEAIEKRKTLKKHYWTLYFSHFLPICCFLNSQKQIIRKFN